MDASVAPSSRPEPSLRSRLLALVLGTLVGLALAEGIVRLVSPPQSVVFSDPAQKSFHDLGVPTSLDVRTLNGLRFRPNSSVEIRNHALNGRTISIRTNEFGFRGRAVGPKTPGEFRILVLGDSITFGDYLQEDETLPAVLERQLRASHPGLRVINAGKPGADLLTESYIFLESGLAVEPDLVLVASYLNDATTIEYLRPLTGVLSRSAFAVKLYETFNRVRILKAIEKNQESNLKAYRRLLASRKVSWSSEREAWEAEKVSRSYDWGSAWLDTSWKSLEKIYRDLSVVAGKRGIPVAVALLPHRRQVELDWVDDVPQRSFEDVMRRLSLPHVDLLPPLRQACRSESAPLYYDHCHNTPEGTRLVGHLIATFLLERKLVPASRGGEATGTTP